MIPSRLGNPGAELRVRGISLSPGAETAVSKRRGTWLHCLIMIHIYQSGKMTNKGFFLLII